MKKSIFIAGTDTDIGKTTVAKWLAEKLIEDKRKVIYYKPVQSGGSGDSDAISKTGADIYNSYTMDAPFSPHLASEMENVEIDRNEIVDKYKELLKSGSYTVVEGAGGVIVPIIRNEYYIWEMILDMDIPVLLVTELRVGGINHTLLSYEFLVSKGIEIRAIFANRYSDSEFERDNKRIVEEYTGLEVITEFKGADDIEKLFD